MKETPRELAIGTDEGFQPDKPKYELDTSSSIVLMPNYQVMKSPSPAYLLLTAGCNRIDDFSCPLSICP